MRGNTVKQKLKAGTPVFGTMVSEFFTPGIAQIATAAGAEFIVYDMEHSGVGLDTVKQQMACCRGLDVVPLVRVPAFQPHFVARCLDIGALGIMVPMVETAAQAREIVTAVRYPPAGRRGAAFGVAHDDYLGGPVDEKIATGNERTLVIALIETPEGIRNVGEIAAVDGIDVLWLGQFDLTSFMGVVAEFQHPGYLAAVDELVAAGRRHGKALGTAGNAAWLRDHMSRGFTMIAFGTDIALYQTALAEGLTAARTSVPSTPPLVGR